MIKVYNPETNRNILVMWRHKVPQQPLKKELGSTTCFICDDNRESIIVHAEALQSKHDQFSRKIGRKVSFKRAINDSDLPKYVRKLVWEKYFEMQGGKVK